MSAPFAMLIESDALIISMRDCSRPKCCDQLSVRLTINVVDVLCTLQACRHYSDETDNGNCVGSCRPYWIANEIKKDWDRNPNVTFALDGKCLERCPRKYRLPISAIIQAICRPSGCTVVSGVVVVGLCNRSQVRTTKYTCLIFGVNIDLDHG